MKILSLLLLALSLFMPLFCLKAEIAVPVSIGYYDRPYTGVEINEAPLLDINNSKITPVFIVDNPNSPSFFYGLISTGHAESSVCKLISGKEKELYLSLEDLSATKHFGFGITILLSEQHQSELLDYYNWLMDGLLKPPSSVPSLSIQVRKPLLISSEAFSQIEEYLYNLEINTSETPQLLDYSFENAFPVTVAKFKLAKLPFDPQEFFLNKNDLNSLLVFFNKYFNGIRNFAYNLYLANGASGLKEAIDSEIQRRTNDFLNRENQKTATKLRPILDRLTSGFAAPYVELEHMYELRSNARSNLSRYELLLVQNLQSTLSILRVGPGSPETSKLSAIDILEKEILNFKALPRFTSIAGNQLRSTWIEEWELALGMVREQPNSSTGFSLKKLDLSERESAIINSLIPNEGPYISLIDDILSRYTDYFDSENEEMMEASILDALLRGWPGSNLLFEPEATFALRELVAEALGFDYTFSGLNSPSTFFSFDKSNDGSYDCVAYQFATKGSKILKSPGSQIKLICFNPWDYRTEPDSSGNINVPNSTTLMWSNEAVRRMHLLAETDLLPATPIEEGNSYFFGSFGREVLPLRFSNSDSYNNLDEIIKHYSDFNYDSHLDPYSLFSLNEKKRKGYFDALRLLLLPNSPGQVVILDQIAEELIITLITSAEKGIECNSTRLTQSETEELRAVVGPAKGPEASKKALDSLNKLIPRINAEESLFIDWANTKLIPKQIIAGTSIQYGSEDMSATLDNIAILKGKNYSEKKILVVDGLPKTDSDILNVFGQASNAMAAAREWKEVSDRIHASVEKYDKTGWNRNKASAIKSSSKTMTRSVLFESMSQSDGIIFITAHADKYEIRLGNGQLVTIRPEDLDDLKLPRKPFVYLRVCDGRESGFAEKFLRAGACSVWINDGKVDARETAEEFEKFIGLLGEGNTIWESIRKVTGEGKFAIASVLYAVLENITKRNSGAAHETI